VKPRIWYLDRRADVAYRQECRDAAARLREVAAGMGDDPDRQERWLSWADDLDNIAKKAVV
jgi:hypothetical protein